MIVPTIYLGWFKIVLVRHKLLRSGTPRGWIWVRDEPIAKTLPNKRPPEGGLSVAPIGAEDQATRSAELPARRRYVMKPTPAKPRISIAQVEGSGTAGAGGISLAPPHGLMTAPGFSDRDAGFGH